jgi:hypothetical protein
MNTDTPGPIENLVRRLRAEQMVTVPAGYVVNLLDTNARLLDAIENLVARFPEGLYEGAFSKQARAAIAKAKGEKS